MRTIHYVVCTQCNNRQGPTEETKEGAKEAAQLDGFQVDVLVPNGSLWDFCPRCVKNKTSEV